MGGRKRTWRRIEKPRRVQSGHPDLPLRTRLIGNHYILGRVYVASTHGCDLKITRGTAIIETTSLDRAATSSILVIDHSDIWGGVPLVLQEGLDSNQYEALRGGHRICWPCDGRSVC